jgi:hypothetical protein
MNREQWITSIAPKGLGIEIGVQSGYYASRILELSELHLVVLDAWRELEGYPDLANSPTGHHLTLMNNAIKTLLPYEGRFTLIREKSEVAVGFFPDSLFDFIYIDANHQEDAVRGDLINWWPKVKSGGIFAGHDYINLKDEVNDFGVKDAVDKFFGQKGLTHNIVDAPFSTWWIKKP